MCFLLTSVRSGFLNGGTSRLGDSDIWESCASVFIRWGLSLSHIIRSHPSNKAKEWTPKLKRNNS